MLLLQKQGRREIDTTPITNLYAVGECHPEPLQIVLERFVGEADLAAWQFRVYGVNAAKEPVYQDILLHETHEETICLCWKINRTFTAFAGVLHLELHALSADTKRCLHYRMDDIWIRPSVWGVGLPLTARMQEIYCQMQKLCHDAALLSLHLPQISETGTWLLYDKNTADYVDTGIPAKGEKGDTGAQGERGDAGTDGVNGADGADGFSPIANVIQTETGAILSVTDKTGTTTAVIQNGKDGADGAKGDTGEQGIQGEKGDTGLDGFSPTVMVEQTETGATITATDKNGTTSAEIKNGTDGSSETVDLSEYAKKEDLVGRKTAKGGEIFNDYGNNSAGLHAHAEGDNTVASGESSHAEGKQGSTASGESSHAEGSYTKASGNSSHAEGHATQAIGNCSHAEGGNGVTSAPTAYGVGSHAEGMFYNNAYGNGSHAEGYMGTNAYGEGSHAEGYYTTAGTRTQNANGTYTYSGNYAHAEGASTTASGNCSHAEGAGTTASGQNSHAEGISTKASSECQHVQGKYNIEDTEDKYAFIIGNGTSDSNRSNAVAIDWNGLIYLNNSNTGIDLSNLSTKEEAAQAIEYAHTHQNKTTLNKITAAKFESWETAVQQIGDIQTILENVVGVSE